MTSGEVGRGDVGRRGASSGEVGREDSAANSSSLGRRSVQGGETQWDPLTGRRRFGKARGPFQISLLDVASDENPADNSIERSVGMFNFSTAGSSREAAALGGDVPAEEMRGVLTELCNGAGGHYRLSYYLLL